MPEEQIDPAGREARLLKLLAGKGPGAHLTEALDEVEAFHPPAVIEALIRGALNRDGTSAVHFAAMVYYLHGKATEPFDWGQRPFFLRFNTADRGEREAAFGEMCRAISVEAAGYLKA